MQTLLLYTLISTACFYLGSRALITRWLWSRYPRDLALFMDCSACAGFWYGALASIVLGNVLDPVFMTNAAHGPIVRVVGEAFFVGLCTLVLTPTGAGMMQSSLETVGSAIDTDSQKEG